MGTLAQASRLQDRHMSFRNQLCCVLPSPTWPLLEPTHFCLNLEGRGPSWRKSLLTRLQPLGTIFLLAYSEFFSWL
jgi:hypothetical protein